MTHYPAELARADHLLLPEELDQKYNPDGDGEHPHYSRWTWRQAVAQECTISGYWAWVAHKIDEDYL